MIIFSLREEVAGVLSLPELQKKFFRFSQLPAEGRAFAQRKAMVRALQDSVENGQVDLSPSQFLECRRSEYVLARILAYLLQEHVRFQVSSMIGSGT